MLPDSKIAVIGPFYNGERHVEGWLSALSLQTHSDFTIYLVDDSSQDETARLAKLLGERRGLNLQVIALPKNAGPSAARNIAIKQAIADGAGLILLLDSDCRVEPDWLERHLTFHRQVPEVQILGGSIQGQADSIVGKADGFCSWFTAVPNSRSGQVRLHLSSTNMSIKSSVFSTIGFFDETLATGEDVAFCRKARLAGLLLWLQSDIVVTHLDRNELAAAKRHHYRWGLHSYTLSLQEQGGYYGFLKKLKVRWLAAFLVPVIAFLNTVLILIQYTPKKPQVWLYIPWIVRLKWSNAMGVYRGFINPKLCLKQ